MKSVIRIGTRGSRMALYQANQVLTLLQQKHDSVSFEITVIQSEGDLNQGNLHEFGGKGAFVRALDKALIEGRIDVAVNCMKDIPHSQERSPDITIIGALPREQIVDAFITKTGVLVNDLPGGSVVGSSAPRRQALLKRLYPHLECKSFRGSADTRVRKLDQGEVDVIILALAGLQRIGLESRVTELTDPNLFLPAIGAGIVTIDCLRQRVDLISMIAGVSDASTLFMVAAERSFINSIKGNCHTAIAGYSHVVNNRIEMIAAVMSEDGETMLIEKDSSDLTEAETLGDKIANSLRAQGADRLLRSLK